MKKILLGLSILLLSANLQAANTITYRDGSVVITAAQIQTTATNSTDSFSLGPYQAGSIQCAWASITGTQPVFNLQVSNNETNWDSVDGASLTTTAASGSNTWIIDPLVSRFAKIYVSTTSTTGTLDCVSVLKK